MEGGEKKCSGAGERLVQKVNFAVIVIHPLPYEYIHTRTNRKTIIVAKGMRWCTWQGRERSRTEGSEQNTAATHTSAEAALLPRLFFHHPPKPLAVSQERAIGGHESPTPSPFFTMDIINKKKRKRRNLFFLFVSQIHSPLLQK